MTALKCYICRGTEDDCKKSTLEGDKGKYLRDCGEGNDKRVGALSGRIAQLWYRTSVVTSWTVIGR